MESSTFGLIERVYLARHGRTEWNTLGRRQGQLDSPLTPEGLASAMQLAQLIARQPVDAVFSSPLGRAASTAAIFADFLKVDVVVIDELQEVHHGSMAGLTNHQIDAGYAGELLRRRHNRYQWRFPGGESYADADRRAANALASISRLGSRFPLIVSHEMIGRMLIRNLLDLSPGDALAVDHPHDVLYCIDPATKQCTDLRA
jgi:broad specificity phosphatase PhoE